MQDERLKRRTDLGESSSTDLRENCRTDLRESSRTDLRENSASVESLFLGVNHVFDQRNGGQVGAQRIAPQVLGRCHVCCSSSDDQKDCAYKHCPRPFYKRRFILCTSCSLRLGACCRYIFSRVLSIVTLYSKYTKALRERERERESFVRNYP